MVDPEKMENTTKSWLKNKYVLWGLTGVVGLFLLILFRLPLLMLGIGFVMGWMYCNLKNEKREV